MKFALPSSDIPIFAAFLFMGTDAVFWRFLANFNARPEKSEAQALRNTLEMEASKSEVDSIHDRRETPSFLGRDIKPESIKRASSLDHAFVAWRRRDAAFSGRLRKARADRKIVTRPETLVAQCIDAVASFFPRR